MWRMMEGVGGREMYNVDLFNNLKRWHSWNEECTRKCERERERGREREKERKREYPLQINLNIIKGCLPMIDTNTVARLPCYSQIDQTAGKKLQNSNKITSTTYSRSTAKQTLNSWTIHS